jgi:hypothetical protein
MEDNQRSYRETFRVNGDEIASKIKEIIKEGNARRIIIKDDKEVTLMEFPLTIGAIGVLLVPIYAAVGALAALAMDYTIIVEKRESSEKS